MVPISKRLDKGMRNNLNTLAKLVNSRITDLKFISSFDVRRALIEGQEIALLDVREEAEHAQAHPLFAANLSISRIELDAPVRLPRRNVSIAVFDNGEGFAELAVRRLTAMGYSDVSLLQDGLQGWRDAGYEIFRDVNSASKAFGELVEAQCHTPSLSAQEALSLIEAKEDIVIVDVRRYDEFQTMSIPTGISVPGAELVFRLQGLSERPSTRIIVNCAGRTRSLIGTQSLINSGLPNKVFALRNGTIGWKLAHQSLSHGATEQAPAPDAVLRQRARYAARHVADRAGVRHTTLEEVQLWQQQNARTIYFFDVRTPAEYIAGHLPFFRSAPGGQLVQEADMFAPVRGARIVLADDDGSRANMTASWLAQMNWEVYVLEQQGTDILVSGEQRSDATALATVPESSTILPQQLHAIMQEPGCTILDFSRSRVYLKGHIPGAQFALRSRLPQALQATASATQYVVTASEPEAAWLAWNELQSLTTRSVLLLVGGNTAWQDAGYSLESASPSFASDPVDYYRRPYEGTDASPEAMQAYLDWEYGLVEQLKRDGTHGFRILQPYSVED